MPQNTASPNQPNVIVFFTDQQRWDTVGLHGNPLDLTPNFDRLASAGTFVANSFTCQPVCGPARSCLQTGLYATQTGSYVNGTALDSKHLTLAHRFGAAGYQTGYIGKWHLANGDGPVEVHERGGYNYWLASNVLEFTSDAYDVTVYDNNNQAVKLPGYRVDALTDAAIRYIDTHRDRPFYLFVSYIEPHHQNSRDDYPAPLGYEDRYRDRWAPPDLAALVGSAPQHLAGYLGMVKRLDEAYGRLHDALASLRLSENTVTLFTSDHGNHFKTRNEEYKRSCHESSIRVPTSISGPGFAGGGRIDEIVSLVDLPATLLDAAHIPVPPQMSGRSLLPLLRGQASDWPDEAFVQISEAEFGRALRTERWKYHVLAPDIDSWSQPHAERYVEAHLYDLQADPYELNNLVDDPALADVRADLRARLLVRMAAAGEPPAAIESRSSPGDPPRDLP